MLQVLLEDRFKLKVHRETREGAVYFLTVAKKGLKLKPLTDGACAPIDQNAPTSTAGVSPSSAGAVIDAFRNRTPPARGGSRPCPQVSVLGGATTTVDIHGADIASVARILSEAGLGRPVVDNTGLSGFYDIHLKFASDPPGREPREPEDPGNRAAPTTSADASIFTAIQDQLGLKLSAGKGSTEVLVIDHVDRPAVN